MTINSNALRSLQSAISGSVSSGDSSSYVNATVESAGGDEIWVRFDGSDTLTPVESTFSAVNVGDSVSVRVADGKASIVGNMSAPATDDTAANAANDTAETAHAAAESASMEASAAMAMAEDTSNYFWHDSTGAYVSGSASSKSGKHARVTTTSFDIMDGSKTVASYGSDGVKFYADGESSPCVNIDNDSIDFYNTSVSKTVPRVSMTSSSSHGSVVLANKNGAKYQLWAQASGLNMQAGTSWVSVDDGTSSYSAGFHTSGHILGRGNSYAWYGNSTYGTSLNYSSSNGVHGLYSNAKGKWIVGMNSSGVTSLYNTSSRKTKENIEPMPDEQGLALLDVEVVDFDYKPEYGGGKNLTGVIAEDTADIVPEALIENVSGCSDDEGEVDEIMGIDYSKFIPRLIKLCQIQQREIEELKQRLERLGG